MNEIDDTEALGRSSQRESELDQHAERKRSETELTILREELSADRKTMVRLYELCTRLLGANELQTLLEEFLDDAEFIDRQRTLEGLSGSEKRFPHYFALGLVQDITQRKRAEEQVRKAHEQIDMLLESISDNFFGLDKEGRFIYFNKHAADQIRTIGRDPDAAIGEVSWEVCPGLLDREDIVRVLTERVVIVNELFYEPLQEWVENHMYPSQDGGLVTFQRYITERKRTEEELRKTQAELAHVTRLTTVGELTASIAHEVNQPLGAIVTNGHACLHLLSRDQPDLAEVRQAVECIIADGLRAGEVIKRVRRLAKKSSGGKSSHSINNIVREVLALVAVELTRNDINVQPQLALHLPFVLVDRIQIQQVVLNLILNSKEAMSLAGRQPRDLMIQTAQTGPEVMVTVADTGVGMGDEDRQRAFDPFFTTKEGGLGLGLSISKTIIDAHGGRLWSKPNQHGDGTTFQFTLPTV